MSEKWIRDTGLVFALLFLVLGIIRGAEMLFVIAGVFLVALLLAPVVLTPLAWVWLKLSEILGYVMNRVFFGLVFFIVVVPVGMLRRILIGDARDLAAQPLKGSAFIDRDHVVVPGDLAKPF